jgi:hypothetical protein
LQAAAQGTGLFYRQCRRQLPDGDHQAVKAFQDALGLEQRAVATVSLQRKLFASSAPANTENSDKLREAPEERHRRVGDRAVKTG